MPYIKINLLGSSSACGYLSIDGKKSTLMTNGKIFKVSEGTHTIAIHTKSDLERKAGKFQQSTAKFSQGAFGNGIAGKAIDTMQNKQASNAIGESWQFSETLTANSLVEIQVETYAGKFSDTPAYDVCELNADEVAKYESAAGTIDDENTPKRSPLKIFIGVWMLIGSIAGAASMISSGAVIDATTIAAFGIVAVIGVLLFINGIKKKIRK